MKWIIIFCSSFFNWKPVPEYQSEIIDVIYEAWIKKIPRVLLEPRKHGKTIALICLFAFWIIEKKKSLLVITSDASAKSRIYAALHSIIKSPLVRMYYGDMILRASSQTGEIWFKDEIRGGIDPSCRVAGWDGTYIGSHADAVHLEDVVQEEAVSEDTNLRIMERVENVILDISDRITVSGTRKGFNDLYIKLYKIGFLPLHRKAIELISGRWPNENDCEWEEVEYDNQLVRILKNVKLTGTFRTLNCPNFLIEDLLKIRIVNLARFQSQFQNEPMAAGGNILKDRWLRYAEEYKANRTRHFIAVDPAFSESSFKRSSKHDDWAILVCAIWDHRLILVDGIIDQLTFPDAKKIILYYYQKYRQSLVIIEENREQKWLTQDLIDYGVYSIKGIMAIKNKKLRLDSLIEPFQIGAITIYRNFPAYAQFKQQYLMYDGNPRDKAKGKRVDALDCLEMIYREAKPYLMKIKIDNKSKTFKKLKVGSYSSRNV